MELLYLFVIGFFLSWVIIGVYVGFVAAVAYTVFKVLTKKR